MQFCCLQANLSSASLHHFNSSYLLLSDYQLPLTPAKQVLLYKSLGFVQQKSSLHLLVQAMHSRDRLPNVVSHLASSLHGQAEAGDGNEGGGGEQVQQDQVMHGALFQVILQQLGEPLLLDTLLLLLWPSWVNYNDSSACCGLCCAMDFSVDHCPVCLKR